MKFDAVIVGAGPAGSTAAILLARGGWSVALVERQEFPRRKVCGECVAASNLPLLHALGVGATFATNAGPELSQVVLLHGNNAVIAKLPAANHEQYAWGRALGRETLDTLLLEQAHAAGAHVFQPWSVQRIMGSAGDWQCEVRAAESTELLCLRTAVVIDAHGSWEDLPSQRQQHRPARSKSDLFAFKANFTGSAVGEGAINVIALDGGYGGMVVANSGTTTVACCIRRDRLNALRCAAPGLRAGDVVQEWLQRECSGVRHALQGALREGPWLATGPIDPGVRMDANSKIFSIGNAAGEAHPILGEGISMGLQSAAILCQRLLDPQLAGQVPTRLVQAKIQRRYVAEWRREFAPRMRLAALFAHIAMRPHSAAALVSLVRVWPELLTRAAVWGGKVHAVNIPRPSQEISPWQPLSNT